MSPLTAAGRIRTELGVPFAMDLIVRSEADIARRIAWKDCFIREIMEKGITLYAAILRSTPAGPPVTGGRAEH